jgi:hypothetical protein
MVTTSTVVTKEKGGMEPRFGIVASAVVSVALAAAVVAGAHPTRESGSSFSGNGSKTLPPFRVASASTLLWTNSGDIFQIFPKGLGGGGVNSQGRSGATYVRPGSYRLSVNALGSWTIRIVAGVERPRAMTGGRVGFRGDGSRDLPPFTTRHGGQLAWTATGDIFQIFPKDYGGGGDVNSQARRGTTYLDAGTHELSVNALGSWTLSWKP